MTQLQLAEKMGVTDKAVSKWERDLSCPDIGSLPALADALGVRVETLLQAKSPAGESSKPSEAQAIVSLILKGISLAMGAAVVVLSFLRALDAASGFSLLGIGLFCLALDRLRENSER